MWEYSSKNVKISNFGHKFTPQGRLVCCIFTIFSAFVRVYRYLLSFLVLSLSGDKRPRYKHFPAVGAFSLKFSIAPSGESKDQIKKVRRRKNGADLLYRRAKYGGDRGSYAGCRPKKCDVFLSGFHAFGMTETR